jgi:hypothetical protein
LQKVRIYFKIFERDDWRDLPHLDVDPSEPSEFMRIIRKYTRKTSMNVFVGSKIVTPLTRFEDIIAGGNHTLHLTTESEIDTNKLTSTSEKGSGPKSNPETSLEPERKRNRHDAE